MLPNCAFTCPRTSDSFWLIESMSKVEGSGGLNTFDSVVIALPSTWPLPACAEIDRRMGLMSTIAPIVSRCDGATNNSKICVFEGVALSNVPEARPDTERLDEFTRSTALLSTLLIAPVAWLALTRFVPLLSRLPKSFPLPDLVLIVTVTGEVWTCRPSRFRSNGLSVIVVRTFELGEGVGVGALKSPATGMVAFGPNVNVPALALPAFAVCRSDHFAVFGSNVPMPSVLSPFQSPVMGRVFLLPNLNDPAFAEPADAVCRNVHFVLPGSNVPMPSLPSPFQSPATGSAYFAPNLKTPAFADPADAPSRTDHVALFGSYAPMSSRPSPFQSPTTGMLPFLP